jgi:hypothetical protein
VVELALRFGEMMKDPKVTVRYLGFYALTDGGRRYDFSFSGPDASQHLISVEAP